LKITEHTFSKVKLDRKTEPYQKAINIAKMILLNYHPDINKGSNNVLALFFDMNLLWEKYVAKVLRTYLPIEFIIATQNRALFWQSDMVSDANIKPDILVKKNDEVIAILDTKWKLPYDNRPKDEDLKQMFSYNKIFNSTQSWLVYPNDVEDKKEGVFVDGHGGCGMMMVTALENGELNHEGLYRQVEKSLVLLVEN
jgi:5-methylcytosine-specific restriction enzyme subunit McrC